jgi:N-acetylglucosamine-6-sulfatase
VRVSKRIGAALIASGLLAGALQACTGSAEPNPTPDRLTPPSKVSARGKPNIVVLLSDDQASHLFNRRLMPNVFSQLVDQGVNFNRFYVNTSQCCPSRASILTGLYAHNTGVDSNSVQLDGQDPLRPVFPLALQQHGYRTMLDGKYLNSERCDPQPGWDRWVCGTKNTEVDPTLNVDGRTTSLKGYTADLLADLAIRFIHNNRDPDHPFFLYYAPKDPHLPANDPRHRHMVVPAYRPPSFNVQPDPGSKPTWTRRPALTPQEVMQQTNRNGNMTRQIPSLDAAIGRILDAIKDRADNTLVMFLSDNGFLYGEHRMTDKNQPYEESVRVPFVLRFPRLLPPTDHFESGALVENVDLAPTIMQVAGIGWEADGRSVVPILTGRASSLRDGVLIEWCQAGETTNCRPEEATRSTNIPPYFGIVTDRYVYVEYRTGERELYDLNEDPYELINLAARPGRASLRKQLAAKLAALRAPPQTPGTTIVAGPIGRVPAATVLFEFFAQSRRSSLQCRLRGPGQDGTWHPCDGGSVTYQGLSPGAHSFTVKAIDQHGHEDPSPASRGFTVG